MNKDQVNAALRHVYTAVGAIVAVLVAIGYMGQADADKLIALVTQIGGSVDILVGAIGALIPVMSAIRAAWSASPAQQISKVDKIDGVEVKVDPLAAPPAAIAAANDPALPNVTLKEP